MIYLYHMIYWPFKRQPHKIVEHAHTIRQILPTNCLSVFDHFVGWALNGIRVILWREKGWSEIMTSNNNNLNIFTQTMRVLIRAGEVEDQPLFIFVFTCLGILKYWPVVIENRSPLHTDVSLDCDKNSAHQDQKLNYWATCVCKSNRSQLFYLFDYRT